MTKIDNLEMNKEIQNRKGLKIRNLVVSSLLISSISLIGGCAKDVDCKLGDRHAHFYTSESTFDKYLVSEKEYIGSHIRTEEYKYIDKEEEDILKFAHKKDLFRIDENKEAIEKITSEQGDYKEYQYEYTWLMPIPHYQSDGKNTTLYYTYIPTESTSWTTDSQKSDLTGEERVVHYVYHGYKVEENEKGKLQVVQSENYDSINQIPNEYEYISSKFYKKVRLDNKDIEIEYEEEHEHVNDESRVIESSQQIKAKKINDQRTVKRG